MVPGRPADLTGGPGRGSMTLMKTRTLLIALLILTLIGAGFGGYTYHRTDTALKAAEASLASTTAALTEAQVENQDLSDALASEKARNDDFEKQIDSISGTVGKLDKLSKIDPQLLAKCSKVYFLNENYVPSRLTQIPQQYVADDNDEYFLAEAWPFMKDMLEAAKEDGVDLKITSSYRSFERQTELKTSYKITYGSGANAFSADQGYSEHQLGTAADFTSKEVGNGLSGSFASSTAGAWLTKNAYRYGFILSYPKGNSYYVYEPWHWRFVGRDLAKALHEDGKRFYDLDQRDINEYLIDLFD